MSRLLPVVLGMWLGLLVASWVAATQTFRTVDRVLGPAIRAELRERLAPVAADDRRVLLRHLASEINRWMFRHWSLAQLALGVLALALAWRLPGPGYLLLSAAIVVCLVQAFGLAGPITELGRTIDFPRPLPAETARRFGLLHAAYVGLDLAKAALLAGAAWVLVPRLA